MSRLLLVGWDGADWKFIRSLLAAGEMPALARLIHSGVHGHLSTINPQLSPVVWTSIATGKRPPGHGILGFTEPARGGLGIKPTGSLSRGAKALWNIAHQSGLRSIVVGWRCSHPAEPIRGAVVSDLFALHGEDPSVRPLGPRTVWPESLADRLAALRVHPCEVGGDILKLFVRDWTMADPASQNSLHELKDIVAETMSIHSTAGTLLESQPWDLAAVCYSGLGELNRRFGNSAAKKLPREKDAGGGWLSDVVRNGYRYHDVMLNRLLTLAGEDCAVMLVGERGSHSEHLLPDYIPTDPAGPAMERGGFGIFCLRAPGARTGEEIYGAGVLDVVPTALHLLGLPAACDMDGKVLVNAFRDECHVRVIESWEVQESGRGMQTSAADDDPEDGASMLAHLVVFGYMPPPSGNADEAVAECLRERRYNLARAHADAGRADLAIPLLQELIVEDREDARFYLALFPCLLSSGNYQGYRRLLADFDHSCNDFAPRVAAELRERRARRSDRAVADALRGNTKPGALRELFERRRLSDKADGYFTDRLFLRCRLALASPRSVRQRELARGLLEQLAKLRNPSNSLRLFLAEGFAILKEYDRALALLSGVLRADSDDWQALGLASRIHLARRQWEKAVDYAAASLALVYSQPELHHLLGSALTRLGEQEKAERALRAAVALAPRYPRALEALGRLICRDRARTGEGALLIALAREFRKQAP